MNPVSLRRKATQNQDRAFFGGGDFPKMFFPRNMDKYPIWKKYFEQKLFPTFYVRKIVSIFSLEPPKSQKEKVENDFFADIH